MLKNSRKVLGINARSSIYLRVNKRKAKTIADDKLRTKELLIKHGIGAADLLAVIRDKNDLKTFDWESLPTSFVLKPNRGLGGEGIVIIYNRLKNGKWLGSGKREYSEEDLIAHVQNIIDGNYSLSNSPDVAVCEARLSIDPLYKRFAEHGIPDIRIIVYNNVPVMAMLRMPTKKSKGKANLMQGGIGIGIDVTTGMTTHAVTKGFLYEKEIDVNPETGKNLRGIRLPYWDKILKTAVLSSRVVGLKYGGVDISVDKKNGPVVLELNARPGLGIQVANMAPLRDRLSRIRGVKVKTPERGIAIAKDLFSGQFDARVEEVTGRQVIGLVESVYLKGKEDKSTTVKAKIDTGADDSSVDIELARKLGFGDVIDLFQAQDIPEGMTKEEAQELVKTLQPKLRKENKSLKRLSVVSSSHGVSIRPHVRLKVRLDGYNMNIEPNIYNRGHMTYPILIGRKNLSHFLIDTTKKNVKKVIKKGKKQSVRVKPKKKKTEVTTKPVETAKDSASTSTESTAAKNTATNATTEKK